MLKYYQKASLEVKKFYKWKFCSVFLFMWPETRDKKNIPISRSHRIMTYYPIPQII